LNCLWLVFTDPWTYYSYLSYTYVELYFNNYYQIKKVVIRINQPFRCFENILCSLYCNFKWNCHNSFLRCFNIERQNPHVLETFSFLCILLNLTILTLILAYSFVALLNIFYRCSALLKYYLATFNHCNSKVSCMNYSLNHKQIKKTFSCQMLYAKCKIIESRVLHSCLPLLLNNINNSTF